MKTSCGFAVISLLALAQLGWASCPEELLSTEIADLPGQQTPLGCSSDDPEILPDRCDWFTTVLRDARIDDSDRRLVVLNSDHKTGSGAWRRLFVYACVEGTPTLVLEQRYLYGARIEQLDEETIVVLSGAWAKEDPVCCPSSDLQQVFTWSPSENRYALTESTQHPQEQR